jgi:hypothetical protein
VGNIGHARDCRRCAGRVIPGPAAPTDAIDLAAAVFTAEAQTCTARSPVVAPTVVEPCTSEGCSSCLPADRWLSTLTGRSDVLPLAFHVGYWNHSGWTDRFAKPGLTERQRDWPRRHGRRSVHTPQAVVLGC